MLVVFFATTFGGYGFQAQWLAHQLVHAGAVEENVVDHDHATPSSHTAPDPEGRVASSEQATHPDAHSHDDHDGSVDGDDAVHRYLHAAGHVQPLGLCREFVVAMPHCAPVPALFVADFALESVSDVLFRPPRKAVST